MKINLYGYGFVGKAHYETLKEHNEINIIDPIYPDLEQADFEPECCIVCVSTPQSDDGSCDMSSVIDVISKIDKTIPVLIKSTISLEGWRHLKEHYSHYSINFSPEFIRQDHYLEDFKNIDTMYVSTEKAKFWATLFYPYWKDLTFVVAEAEELILVKYFRNSFRAVKVTFFNQVYDLCKSTNIDFNEVAAGICQDPIIGFSHSQVTEERGFGGHCLPKDSSALVKTAELFNCELPLINSAREYNSIIKNISDHTKT